MIRTATYQNGQWVYDPPFTEAELAQQRESFASMCQSRIPPGSFATERALMQGRTRENGLEGMPPVMQRYWIGQARKAGISTHGKTYCSQLADQRGPADPLAWCSTQDDVIRVAKARNKTIESCRVKGTSRPPPPDKPLNERIVRELCQKYVNQDPKLGKKPRELREMVIERHGARKDRKVQGTGEIVVK